MINQQLKKALLEKLQVQPAALSKQAQKRKLEMPMSTEEATYLIAHDAGLRLDQYLNAVEVSRIRGLHTAGKGMVGGHVVEKRSQRNQKKGGVREIRFPHGIKVSNPLLPAGKLAEAVQMARLYPLLYVLENSIRELIRRVMTAKFGDDWWDNRLNKGKLKNVYDKATSRMLVEKRYSWHQKRGAHSIDYVDITDLESIILGHQEQFFSDIIPDRAWFENFMKELYPSRNVVCHMNPLLADNVGDLQLKVKKWDRVIVAAQSVIPNG